MVVESLTFHRCCNDTDQCTAMSRDEYDPVSAAAKSLSLCRSFLGFFMKAYRKRRVVDAADDRRGRVAEIPASRERIRRPCLGTPPDAGEAEDRPGWRAHRESNWPRPSPDRRASVVHRASARAGARAVRSVVVLANAATEDVESPSPSFLCANATRVRVALGSKVAANVQECLSPFGVFGIGSHRSITAIPS